MGADLGQTIPSQDPRGQSGDHPRSKEGFLILRCVQRTHKVNLACIAEQLESEHISIEYAQTDMQSADIFTKALPPNKWDHAIRLLGIRVDLPEKLEDVRESRSAKASA